jgi:hypothetical protein
VSFCVSIDYDETKGLTPLFFATACNFFSTNTRPEPIIYVSNKVDRLASLFEDSKTMALETIIELLIELVRR